MVVYFLDWNRYNANDSINVSGNNNKQNSNTLSSKKWLSKKVNTNISIIVKTKTNGNKIRQGARGSIINFCMLFNPINLLCRFFGELYSNIFLKSIVTPLVVLIKFWWGIRSDDRGIDSIPPTPLLNLSCVLCTTCPKSIYHLGDNV